MFINVFQIKARDQKPRQTLRYRQYQMIFLIGWPIVVQLLFMWFQRRNKQKTYVIL